MQLCSKKLTSAVQDAVDLALVQELGMLGLDGLELDGHLLPGRHVGAEVDVTEGAGADFAAQPVLLSDAELHVAFRVGVI